MTNSVLLLTRESYSIYGFDIQLERHFQPHFMRTYLPTGLLVCTSWLSFLVDPNIVPGRMALLLTLLLVLINVSVGKFGIHFYISCKY